MVIKLGDKEEPRSLSVSLSRKFLNGMLGCIPSVIYIGTCLGDVTTLTPHSLARQIWKWVNLLPNDMVEFGDIAIEKVFFFKFRLKFVHFFSETWLSVGPKHLGYWSPCWLHVWLTSNVCCVIGFSQLKQASWREAWRMVCCYSHHSSDRHRGTDASLSDHSCRLQTRQRPRHSVVSIIHCWDVVFAADTSASHRAVKWALIIIITDLYSAFRYTNPLLLLLLLMLT